MLKSLLFAACSVGDVNVGKEQREGEKVEGWRSSKEVDRSPLRRSECKQHEWKEQD